MFLKKFDAVIYRKDEWVGKEICFREIMEMNGRMDENDSITIIYYFSTIVKLNVNGEW
jgi:hypothetical protein